MSVTCYILYPPLRGSLDQPVKASEKSCCTRLKNFWTQNCPNMFNHGEGRTEAERPCLKDTGNRLGRLGEGGWQQW